MKLRILDDNLSICHFFPILDVNVFFATLWHENVRHKFLRSGQANKDDIGTYMYNDLQWAMFCAKRIRPLMLIHCFIFYLSLPLQFLFVATLWHKIVIDFSKSHWCVSVLYLLLCNFQTINEPSHEIVVLFVLRRLILQTRMRSYPVGLDVHTLCVRTAKALVKLHGWAGSPEPPLVACVIISWAGLNVSSQRVTSLSGIVGQHR